MRAGAFLTAVARRLGESCRRHGRSLLAARDAVRGYDLSAGNVHAARHAVAEALAGDGWPADVVRCVAAAWIVEADYLLLPDADVAGADVVVGNPPYVRLEDVPEWRMRRYRRTCPTMTGRADLYVGFYERSLRSLTTGGRLAFICADRWMRNQYGRALRRMITTGFAVEAVVTMHDVDAFEDQVSAYPAVTLIRRGAQRGAAAVQTTREFDREAAHDLVEWLHDRRGMADTGNRSGRGFSASRLPHWFSGDELWPSGSPERLAMIDSIQEKFPPIGDPSSHPGRHRCGDRRGRRVRHRRPRTGRAVPPAAAGDGA